MAVYNEPLIWLRESIKSVLNQTFSDFEFIIINDNPSREENSKILTFYQNSDHRIIVINNEENIGLTKSLNKGLKLARGQYIARMDGDDIAVPERFFKQSQFLESNKSISILGTNMILFDSETGKEKEIKYPTYDNDIKMEFLFKNVVSHPSVMIRASIFKEEGIQYDENFRYSQDFALWIKLAEKYRFHNLEDFLLRYRVSPTQISKSKLEEQNELASRLREEYYNRTFKKLGVKTKKYNNYLIAGNYLFKKKVTIINIMRILMRISLPYSLKTMLYYVKRNPQRR